MNRSLGNDQTINLVQLAEVEHQRSETRRAIAFVREALASGPRPNDAATPYLLFNLVGYLLAVEALDEARDAGRVALEFLRKTDPSGAHTAIAIEHVALAAAVAEEFSCGARLEGYADARIRTTGFQREFTETTAHERLHVLLHDRLSPADLDGLLAEGAGWTAEQAITEAIRICSIGTSQAVQ